MYKNAEKTTSSVNASFDLIRKGCLGVYTNKVNCSDIKRVNSFFCKCYLMQHSCPKRYFVSSFVFTFFILLLISP